MIYRLLSIFILFFCSHICALNCSFPETISDPQKNACNPSIVSNENGDVILTWISGSKNKKRLEVSYKTQNSTWSFPEALSNWETEIFKNYCFVNKKGDLFATWETESVFRQHVAEKIAGKPWYSYLNWITGRDFSVYDTVGFGSDGNLAFVGLKTVYLEPKPNSIFALKTPVSTIAISTKTPDQTEKKSDLSLVEDSSYTPPSIIRLAFNKNGIGYVFSEQKILDQCFLMYQKIDNHSFISKPQIICPLETYLNGWQVSINDKGDAIILYFDEEYNGNIITIFQDVVSSPFLFSNTKEQSYYVSYACAEIDNFGNIMIIWAEEANSDIFNIALDKAGNINISWPEETNSELIIKTMYKPVDQTWGSPTPFLVNKVDFEYPFWLLPDGAGNFTAMWHQKEKNIISVNGSTFSTVTQTWSEPQCLSPKEASCIAHSMSFGQPGKGYIAWTISPSGYEEEGVVQVVELSN